MKRRSCVTAILLILSVVFMTTIGFSTPICIENDVGESITLANDVIGTDLTIDLSVEFDAQVAAPLIFPLTEQSYKADIIDCSCSWICNSKTEEMAILLLSETTTLENDTRTILKQRLSNQINERGLYRLDIGEYKI